MGKKLGWGIIGAGSIAGQFAKGVNGSHHCRLVAVGSRDIEKANKFADQHEIPKRYGSYDELLADPKVEAVYIATPHPFHAEWSVKAAEAGKHILCEKPITLNYPDTMRVIAAAMERDVFLMEGYMYRCHPQTAKVVELVREGAIGDVKVIQATFSFSVGFNPESRLYKNELGGGGILDVGGYPVSFSRLIAGAAQGVDFLDPVEVKGVGHLCETGVDAYAAAVLKFPNEIIAQVATGVGVTQDNSVRIYGTKGNIVVPWPWIPGREGQETKILLKDEEIVIQSDRPLYGIEADTVAENIERRQAPSPAMSWKDTLGNMKTLDAWRDSFGFLYNAEKPESDMSTLTGRPLAVRADAGMKYGEIEGVGKKIARLVMGVDNQQKQTIANAMFDDYYERGGNSFDSAFIYCGGKCETVLGRWIELRGLREEVVILDKGAHTPFCDPKSLTSQLKTSLERLRTDYTDIYMMHRDNPDVPVGEFVEVLNEHVEAGRIRVFGVSNWTIERIEEFNKYAKSKGLRGISAVSNNFSLAEMVQAPWGGCISSSDAESRAWFEHTQTPLMPWSSQAGGFFAVGDPNRLDIPMLVRCWYSDDNFKRLERAKELAAKLKVDAICVALAYVLNQPFPTFPLIGPRTVFETISSIKALDIELTPEQVRWLNLEG